MRGWKKETCCRCIFRVGYSCRYGPPSDNSGLEYGRTAVYPTVMNADRDRFQEACAQYEEEENKNV